MAKNLSEEALIECRKYFWKQDRDRNGKLSWREFNHMCNTIGLHLSEEMLNKAFNIADKDRSGQITFAEFLAAYVSDDPYNFVHDEPITPDKLNDARDYFNSEKLTRVEFVRMALEKKIVMTNEELKRAFDIADNDRDGKISFEEFENIFKDKALCAYGKSSSRKESSKASANHKTLSNEISKLCKYFWYSDKNSDGKLSLTEFLKMLDMLGMQFSHREKMAAFSIADEDGDGMISFKEFANAYLRSAESSTTLSSKHIKELFYKVDKDKDGVLSKEQCVEALKKLGHVAGKRRIERIMGHMDKNSDANISLEEFFTFLDITE